MQPSLVNDPAVPLVAAGGLSKRYGRRQAVTGLSLAVHGGEVCALLGPNGAGKTSTMRMLAGLSRPDAGSVHLLGEPVRLGAPVLRRAGVVIDGPAFVPHLTGLRNLRLLWSAAGRDWPPPALDDALDLAGLGDAVNRRVRGYSMGMKQRLMLAQALMRAPAVLILDEPANGLDPAEVRALRQRLRALASEGAAVLVSSHQLAEVQQLATHAVIMNRGTLVTAGPLDRLLGGARSLEEAFLAVTASHAGHRDGNQGGLFGAATYSALNHTMASLDFTAPLLLPLAVALLASAVGSADRAWGTLRYLYVQPVTRSRLLAGKLAAVLVITAAATGCVLAAGFFTGLALFGWHAFHVIGAPSLPAADAVGRCLAAAGYTLLCMLSIGAIALALGLLLPHGAEALGASLALVIAGSILSAHQHNLAVILPMYYWQDWATLFEPAGTAHLGAGIAAQAAAIAAAAGVSVLVLLRRDPAA